MKDLFGITLDDEIEELKREVRLRLRVYPSMIERGKLNKGEADRHLANMQSALRRLQNIKREAAAHG